MICGAATTGKAGGGTAWQSGITRWAQRHRAQRTRTVAQTRTCFSSGLHRTPSTRPEWPYDSLINRTGCTHNSVNTMSNRASECAGNSSGDNMTGNQTQVNQTHSHGVPHPIYHPSHAVHKTLRQADRHPMARISYHRLNTNKETLTPPRPLQTHANCLTDRAYSRSAESSEATARYLPVGDTAMELMRAREGISRLCGASQQT